MNKYSLILLLLVFPFLKVNAQNKLDSLLDLLHTIEKSDTTKAGVYANVANEYIYVNPKMTLSYADSAISIYEKHNHQKGLANAINNKGIASTITGNFAEGEKCFTRKMEIEKQLGDSVKIAQTYSSFGNLYTFKGDFAKALEYHNKGLSVFKNLNDSVKIAKTYNNMANIYKSYGDYEKCIELYLYSATIDKKINNLQGYATSTMNIANIMADQKMYDKAKSYYRESIKIYDQIGNKYFKAWTLSNFGTIFQEQKQVDSSKYYYKRALQLFSELGDKEGEATTYHSLGELNFDSGNQKDGLKFIKYALKIQIENEFKDDLVRSYRTLGLLHNRMEKYDEAIMYFKKAIDLGLEVVKLRLLSESYMGIAEAYYKTGRGDLAYEYHVKFSDLRDSILSSEKSDKITEMEFKYESEKSEQEIALLNKEKELQRAELEKKQVDLDRQRLQKIGLGAVVGLMLVLSVVIFRSYNQKKKANVLISEKNEELNQSNEELAAQRDEIEVQKMAIEEAHNEIKDSIQYAQRIQAAILPSADFMKGIFPNSFVIYKPKDVVAGDFYWMEQVGDSVFLAVADCTGHGVPGAMVSVVCHNALNKSLMEYNLSDPGAILDKTREIVVAEFSKSDNEVKDGMDIALCKFNFTSNNVELEYAGAHNPLWIIRNGNAEQQVEEIKADRFPVGNFEKQIPFTSHKVSLQKGDQIYLFSDGYADQFGGPSDKKFSYKQLRSVLLNVANERIEQQKIVLNDSFESWKGKEPQLDDVCMIGVRIS